MEEFQIVTATVIQGPMLEVSKNSVQANISLSTGKGYRILKFNLEKSDDISKLKALFSYVGTQSSSFDGKEIRLVMHQNKVVGFAHPTDDKFICMMNSSWYEFTEDGFVRYATAVLTQEF